VIFANKKPPAGVIQPGELVIRVHLPLQCSLINYDAPDKFGEAGKKCYYQATKNPQRVLSNQGS
jgi:hypothetical protein